MNKCLLQLIIFWLLWGIAVTYAQDCAATSTDIRENVEKACAAIGANEICYGNDSVTDEARFGGSLDFNEPGDLADVSNISSLRLTELNVDGSEWGIAQLSLIVNQGSGPQPVTMLLFGDVEVENQAEVSDGVEVAVRAISVNVFPVATMSAGTRLTSVSQGTIVRAIGRLEDSSFIRVEVPETPYVGWVTGGSLADNPAIENLPVQSGDAPYYGAMQAFTFESGTSPNCTETTNDGLLIQTTEGVARVSFLINEVAIELTSAESGASAFVQANPDGEGMSINVLDGTAYVQTGNSTQRVTVEAGSQTTIPLTVNLSPAGSPSHAEPFNGDQISSIPLLDVIGRDSSDDFEPELTSLPPISEVIEQGGTMVVSSGNGGTNTTDGQQSNQNGGQTSSTSGNNTITTGGSNDVTGGRTAVPPIGGSNPQNNTGTARPDNSGELDPVEIALAVGAVVFGIVFVVWMVVRSRSARR